MVLWLLAKPTGEDRHLLPQQQVHTLAQAMQWRDLLHVIICWGSSIKIGFT